MVLCPKTNEGDLTYDGIDNCAERAVEEIDAFIADLANGRLPKVDTVSSSGSSTPSNASSADLLAHEKKGKKAVKGKDKAQLEDDKIDGEPRKVTRFSILGYSLGGLIARFAIGLLYSRSPSFFEVVEPCNFTTFASPAIGIPRFPGKLSWLFSSLGSRLLSRTGEQLYATDDYLNGRPLIEVITQPGTSFHNALLLFKHRSAYANSFNDRTVPFATGYFPKDGHDPFPKAARLARRHQNSDDEVLDFELGGLRLEMEPDCCWIVKSLEEIDPAPAPACKQRGLRLPSLPFFFKPSTFKAMPYGLGYIMPFLMPVLIPGFMVFIAGRFSLQSRYSRKRIHKMRKGETETLEGQLRRVGLALEDTFDAIAEDNIPFTPGHERSQAEAELGTTNEPDIEAAMLSPAQQRAVDNLNAIPDLHKYIVHMPEVRHAHGAIVARDLAFEDHKKGLLILAFWAKRFEF